MKDTIDKIHDTIVMSVIIICYVLSLVVLIKYVIDVYNDQGSIYLIIGAGLLLLYGILMSLYFVKINSK